MPTNSLSNIATTWPEAWVCSLIYTSVFRQYVRVCERVYVCVRVCVSVCTCVYCYCYCYCLQVRRILLLLFVLVYNSLLNSIIVQTMYDASLIINKLELVQLV